MSLYLFAGNFLFASDANMYWEWEWVEHSYWSHNLLYFSVACSQRKCHQEYNYRIIYDRCYMQFFSLLSLLHDLISLRYGAHCGNGRGRTWLYCQMTTSSCIMCSQLNAMGWIFCENVENGGHILNIHKTLQGKLNFANVGKIYMSQTSFMLNIWRATLSSG